ncbi:zinc finger protein 180-like [Latimeria chalumnae]|uniref:zinc finger protein 180-like n=1 Tax=Latimeria chalumnae TaxID=7897 RepID=UPI0003C13314|nr:PREDICTED: zinc finger protein 180-like [Latimeria chalumnae]|eukprot:XP_006010330.1 PREDICTED: zinc finger protein 180-like [Latimeria chalumnae]
MYEGNVLHIRRTKVSALNSIYNLTANPGKASVRVTEEIPQRRSHLVKQEAYEPPCASAKEWIPPQELVPVKEEVMQRDPLGPEARILDPVAARVGSEIITLGSTLIKIEFSEQEPSENPGQEPSENFKREPSDNYGQEPSEKSKQEPLKNFKRESSDNYGQKPSENSKQEPLKNFKQEPLDNYGQEPSENSKQEPLKNFKQEPSDNYGQEPSENSKQEPSEVAPFSADSGVSDEEYICTEKGVILSNAMGYESPERFSEGESTDTDIEVKNLQVQEELAERLCRRLRSQERAAATSISGVQCSGSPQGLEACVLHDHCYTEKGVYKCKECRIRFADPNSLRAHAELHDNEIVCVICSRRFSTPWLLKMHQQVHKATGPYECLDCGRSFQTVSYFKKHMKVHQKETSCNICGKGFISFWYLRMHQRIHTGLKPYKCEYCTRGFRDASALKVHRKTHLEKELLRECAQCGMIPGRFTRNRPGETAGEKPRQCSRCSSQLSSSWLRHTQQVTLAERGLLQRPECGKSSPTLAGLETHRTKQVEAEKPYSCAECGKSYKYARALMLHARAHWVKAQCMVCGKILKTISGLTRHYQKIHTSGRPQKTQAAGGNKYDCAECGQEFPCESELHEHYIRHARGTL